MNVHNPITQTLIDRGHLKRLIPEPDITEDSVTDVMDLIDFDDAIKPLTIDRSCPLCAIVNECIRADNHIDWLLDYSLLCFKSCHAPRTAITTVILGTEFLSLASEFLKKSMIPLLSDGTVSPLDIQVHFYINRCFSKLSGDALENENTTIWHFEVLRNMILERNEVPYKKNMVSLVFTRQDCPEPGFQIREHTSFLEVFFYMWLYTPVYDCQGIDIPEDVWAKKQIFLSDKTVASELGPVLLAPHPVMSQKNQTLSICVLCELSVSCIRAAEFISVIKQKIDDYCQNNLKIIDKIRYIIDDAITASSEDTWKRILRQVDILIWYKHLYCDILCILNQNTLNTKVVFGVPRVNDVKIEICHKNEYLTPYNKNTWLLAQLYKAFQVAPASFKRKTQLNDFVREAKTILRKLDINLVDLHHTIEQYV